jgi:hypothetical protein
MMTISCVFCAAGDPTVFGNLKVPEEAEEAIINAVKDRSYNGYTASVGMFTMAYLSSKSVCVCDSGEGNVCAEEEHA